MNHEHLNTFIKVIEYGSFNKVAELLFMTSSSVMRQINTLEEELGVKLLVRTNKGAKPTNIGEHYYRKILEWNRAYEDIVQSVRQMAQDELLQNVIRIGVSGRLPDQFLTTYWETIRDQFPDLKFEFVSYGIFFEDTMEMVSSVGDKIDVVIDLYEPWSMPVFELDVVNLCNIRVCCAVSFNSELWKKEILEIEDLYGKAISIYDAKQSRMVQGLIEYMNSYPEIRVKLVPVFDKTLFDFGQEELSLGYDTWQGIHPFYKIIPLNIDMKIPFGIWYRKNPVPKVKKFIERVGHLVF